MSDDLSTNVQTLGKKAADVDNPLAAMQYAQAALSLAHAHSTLKEIEFQSKERK